METPVVLDQAGRLGPRNLPGSLANGIRRDVWVDVLKRGLKPSEQDHLVVILALTGRTVGADVGTESGLPTQELKPVEGGLFQFSTIRPASFNAISPSTISPNKHSLFCVQMVTKYALACE